MVSQPGPPSSPPIASKQAREYILVAPRVWKEGGRSGRSSRPRRSHSLAPAMPRVGSRSNSAISDSTNRGPKLISASSLKMKSTSRHTSRGRCAITIDAPPRLRTRPRSRWQGAIQGKSLAAASASTPVASADPSSTIIQRSGTTVWRTIDSIRNGKKRSSSRAGVITK
jgi:hypothetical protein